MCADWTRVHSGARPSGLEAWLVLTGLHWTYEARAARESLVVHPWNWSHSWANYALGSVSIGETAASCIPQLWRYPACWLYEAQLCSRPMSVLSQAQFLLVCESLKPEAIAATSKHARWESQGAAALVYLRYSWMILLWRWRIMNLWVCIGTVVKHCWDSHWGCRMNTPRCGTCHSLNWFCSSDQGCHFPSMLFVPIDSICAKIFKQCAQDYKTIYTWWSYQQLVSMGMSQWILFWTLTRRYDAREDVSQTQSFTWR